MKKVWKKGIALVMAVAVVLSGLYTDGVETVNAEENGIPVEIVAANTLTYEVNEDGETVTITKCNASSNSGSIALPASINGMTVTGLKGTFYQSESGSNVKEVYIPRTVTTIGENTFRECGALHKVAPYGEENLGEGDSWDDVVNVVIPASGSGITPSAEPGGTIYVINKEGAVAEIPNSVTSIGNYAFYGDAQLGTFGFEAVSKTVSIGDYAFSRCSNLIMTLPKSLTTIGEHCFAESANLQIDCSQSSIVVVAKYAFYNCQNLRGINGDLTLPETVDIIAEGAFKGCQNLNTVKMPSKMSQIQKGAFEGCANLHSITVPDGIKDIEEGTFSGCHNLNEVDLPDTLETMGDDAFKDCNNIHDMVIPPSVTDISDSCFSGNTSNSKFDASKNPYASDYFKKHGLNGNYYQAPAPTPNVTVKAASLKKPKKTTAKVKLSKKKRKKTGKKYKKVTAVKLTWKKVSGVSGYELYRKTGKKGKVKKIASVKASKKKYVDKKSIKAGKTYYYAIRTYKIVDGKNYYGAMSKYQKIKIKKTKKKKKK